MLDSLPAPAVTTARVPVEFVGRARAFRAEVGLVDIAMGRALRVITAPLRERLQHHRKLRVETLPGIARQYQELVPVRFRVGAVQGTRHKSDFAIVERRANASTLWCDEWDEPVPREPGVILSTFTLAVHQGRLRQHWKPFANVSLHALARRLERAVACSAADLWADVALLADAGVDGDRVATPGGCWIGEVVDAATEEGVARLRNVRTWITAGGT